MYKTARRYVRLHPEVPSSLSVVFCPAATATRMNDGANPRIEGTNK